MRYKTFTDDVAKIIVMSTYAGKPVRGVAKCDPRDNFDIEKGRELAKARCDLKIARKRHERACAEYKKALEAAAKAHERLENMEQYVSDSSINLSKARHQLDKILEEL